MLTAILGKLLPIVFRAIEQGVAWQIVQKLLELGALILPLIQDAGTRGEIEAAMADLANYQPRPAQPEDPAMRHAEGPEGPFHGH